MKRLSLILLLMVSTNVFAFSLFGPKNYDECILENMKGVTSDNAAIQIRRACRSQFEKKVVECNSQKFTTEEMSKLSATGGVQPYGVFTGNIYNGGQKTIHSIVVNYKPTVKSELVTYRIGSLNIGPLTSGDFSASVHEKTPAVSWDFWAAGCD